jgi:hypothetical protein
MFFLILRSHSTSFTGAQGVPKYKIGLGRGKGWKNWGRIGWSNWEVGVGGGRR